MVIEYVPTIDGKFVNEVMRDDRVAMLLEDVHEEDRHNLVKAVLISGFSSFKININRKISETVDRKIKKELGDLE